MDKSKREVFAEPAWQVRWKLSAPGTASEQTLTPPTNHSGLSAAMRLQ